MNDYVQCWKQFANFQGRTRRSVFWLFVLINFLIACVILAVAFTQTDERQDFTYLGLFILTVLIAFLLAVLLPTASVTVRRLHDANLPGWYVWIILVPVFGIFMLAFWTALDSVIGMNPYGPNPKQISPQNEDPEYFNRVRRVL